MNISCNEDDSREATPPWTCRACGALRPDGDNFCAQCGERNTPGKIFEDDLDRLRVALWALRMIALSCVHRIDRYDTQPAVVADQVLEFLGDDIRHIPDDLDRINELQGEFFEWRRRELRAPGPDDRPWNFPGLSSWTRTCLKCKYSSPAPKDYFAPCARCGQDVTPGQSIGEFIYGFRVESTDVQRTVERLSWIMEVHCLSGTPVGHSILELLCDLGYDATPTAGAR